MATAEFRRKMERLAQEAMAGNAELEAVLAASVETAAINHNRRAASAERKRAASAERRRRQAEGGQNDLAAVLAASVVTAAENQRKRAASAERRRQAPPPQRRNRRKSVTKNKNPLAQHAFDPMGQCRFDGVTTDSLYRFSRDLFYCIHRDGGPLYACDFDKYYTIPTEGVKFNKMKLQPVTAADGSNTDVRMTCTAMILLFTRGGSTYGHFVPYIRINTEWYNADNEKGGLLRRRHGMPDGRTKYYSPDGALMEKIHAAFLFYAPDDLLRRSERPKKDYTGLPVFGQTKDTCGPDGLQTILMFADGFHEYFHEQLYKRLVPQFNPIFWGGAHEEITAAAVDDELRKLKGGLTRLILGEGGGGGGAHSECADPTKEFLLSMFLRLYRIENIPEEELAGIEWGENRTLGEGYERDEAEDIAELIATMGPKPAGDRRSNLQRVSNYMGEAEEGDRRSMAERVREYVAAMRRA